VFEVRTVVGLQRALEEVRRTGKRPVPPHLRNAATDLDRDSGVGKGYRYPHDAEYGVVDQQHLPRGIAGGYYEPKPWGNERLIAERLAWWRQKLSQES
jgi:putative ATPase